MVTNKVTYEFNRESRLLTILITPSNLPNDSSKSNRLGLAIAKKRVKLAVQRNRIKRIIRESFRLNQHNLPPIDMVVMVKSGIDKLDNQEINQQLSKIWRKINQRHKK